MSRQIRAEKGTTMGFLRFMRGLSVIGCLTIACQTAKVQAQSSSDSSGNSSGSSSTPFADWTGSISTTTLPTGSTTISGSNAEAAYVAYQAGAKVADRIAAKICAANPPSGRLLLFNNLADIDAIRSLIIVRRQIQAASFPANIAASITLKKIPSVSGISNPLSDPNGPLGVSWGGAAPQPIYKVAPTIPAQPNFVLPILSAIDAGLQVAALLKSTTTITGATLTADDLSLQILIASRLQSNCPSLKLLQTAYSVPQLQPVDFAAAATSNSPILVLVNDAMGKQNLIGQQSALFTALVIPPLNSAISQLQKLVGTDTLIDAKAALDALPNSHAPAVEAKRKKLQIEISAFPALDAAQLDLALAQAKVAALNSYQSQSAAITASLTGSGGAALQSAVKAEALNCALQASVANCTDTLAKPYVLLTKTTIIGGDNVTKQNIFRTKLGFSGTMAASFVLFDGDGSVNRAGFDQCYAAIAVKDMISTDLMKTAASVTCVP
jgi:hypothetical protein